MARILALTLVLAALLGVANPSKSEKPFDILGASVQVAVVRNGTTLPATLVPFLEPGDTIQVSFPRGVQFSHSPRWHLVVANMYDDYLQHAPTFPIRDADLNAARPGHVWSFPYDGTATPIIFLVPENGGRHGRGIPDARAAMSDLSNRALLAKAALFSENAMAKESTVQTFLRSLASIQPGQLPDGRARIEAATRSLFGYDLNGAPCFDASLAQSTQYACAAQAISSSYQTPTKATVTTALGSQLSVNTATYGMLIGALYQLLAKRRVEAHYNFVPGALKPGSATTNVYVSEPIQYDPSAAKPSTIVYFQIGSEAGRPQKPSYGAAPTLPVCLATPTFDASLTFSGLPVYFRDHSITFVTPHERFVVPASYDELQGYRAALSADQLAELSDGATATVSTQWGFDEFTSPPIAVVTPHAAAWKLEANGSGISEGQKGAILTFADGKSAMGSCVESVTVRDGLGQIVPVTNLQRTSDTVTATIDATAAGGSDGTATVTEAGEPAGDALPFSILPAMPKITRAIAYLPAGVLVLQGSGLKYIDTVTLQHTGIAFANGTPNADGSWKFVSQSPTAFQNAWEHETMTISFTLQPPDRRTSAVEADIQYAATATPSP